LLLQICEDDIECHSYEEISTEPAIKIENTKSDLLVHAVILEMAKFREEFARVTQENVANDLGAFWLRKTKKPVLAVLLVQKPGQPFTLHRGELQYSTVQYSILPRFSFFFLLLLP
jgi:hypothetical protein